MSFARPQSPTNEAIAFAAMNACSVRSTTRPVICSPFIRQVSPNCFPMRAASCVKLSSTVWSTCTQLRSVRMRPSADASSDGEADARSLPQPAMRNAIASASPPGPRAASSDRKQSCGFVKPTTSLR